jgi:hypothetical protein
VEAGKEEGDEDTIPSGKDEMIGIESATKMIPKQQSERQ